MNTWMLLLKTADAKTTESDEVVLLKVHLKQTGALTQ